MFYWYAQKTNKWLCLIVAEGFSRFPSSSLYNIYVKRKQNSVFFMTLVLVVGKENFIIYAYLIYAYIVATYFYCHHSHEMGFSDSRCHQLASGRL